MNALANGQLEEIEQKRPGVAARADCCYGARMKDEIERRFDQNLLRVTNLIASYQNAVAGSGRVTVSTVDALRAAVVFLHATLEDLVRSVLAWRLPRANAEHLEDVPLVGFEPRTKFTLDDIARHRGKMVDDLVVESVESFLQRSSYNDPGDLDRALKKIGIDTKVLVTPHKNQLGAMMARRHWIVHRADRNDAQGSGQHAARSLSPTTVETWLRAVEVFGRAVLNEL